MQPAHPVRALRTLLICSCLASAALPAAHAAATRLPRATPESQGVSSAALLAFVEAADAGVDELHSLMLLRHGRVVAEGWWAPYTAGDRHMLHSLSKSFTSTAVGIAAAEGRLSIDDLVLKFFPDEAPAEPGENLRAMRVRDLLTMSTGHHAEVVDGFGWVTEVGLVRRFLALPVAHKPGTFFIYNSPGTLTQSAIVQKVTGQTVLEYLRPRLFEPLGIADPRWESTVDGITVGTSGLSIRTEDIACFGQMLLQRGAWGGRQLVPAAWVDEATAKQVSNGSDPAGNWDQGYGYQFWRCVPGFARADGAFGQFCFIMPEHDAVLVLTSGVRDTNGLMNLVWDKALPALGAAALPADPAAEAALRQRLTALDLRAPRGVPASPIATQVAGRTYVFPANARKLESITLQLTDGGPALVVRGEGLDGAPIVVGHDRWVRGTTRFGSDVDPRERVLVDRPVAARGGWTAPDTFVAKLCYVETPHALTVRLQFGGDLVVLDGDYNVAFSSNALPQLVGRAAE